MRNPSESDYLKQSLNLLEARVDSARKAQGIMQSKCGNEKAGKNDADNDRRLLAGRVFRSLASVSVP
jgi:hypothetical protein